MKIDADAALLKLESEGAILRRLIHPRRERDRMVRPQAARRIHRYTLNRLRAEIEPVTAADFMRFLFACSTSRRRRA